MPCAWARRPEQYADMAFKAPPGLCLLVPAETNMKDLVKVTARALSPSVGSLSQSYSHPCPRKPSSETGFISK